MTATAAQPSAARAVAPQRGPSVAVETAAAPIGKLTLWNLGAGASGAAFGLLLAWLMGGGDPGSLAYAGLAAVGSTALAVVLVAFLGRRTVFTWATLQIGLSAARLALGLVAAVAFYFAVRDGRLGAGPETVVPSKFAFFGVFLASAAATMVADVAVFRAFLTSMSATSAESARTMPPELSTTRSNTEPSA